jgi:FAR-17a/AIG1-like protein
MMRVGGPQLLLHVLGFSSFAYAIYYDLYEVELPPELAPTREQFGGQAKYLTFLNMALQLLYFFLCLLADFSPKDSRVNRIRDLMFASAAFPIGIFVGFIFWSIWAVDRELIFSARS